jgi:hypothetical protein
MLTIKGWFLTDNRNRVVSFGGMYPTTPLNYVLKRNVRWLLIGWIVLVAGPVWIVAQEQEVAWATYFGGSGDDRITRVVYAEDGDILIAGNTTSPDLAGISPTLIGTDDPTRLSHFGGFFARLSPDGQQVRWLRRFGRGVVYLTDIREHGSHIYLAGVQTAYGQDALIASYNGYDKAAPLSIISEHTGAYTTHAAPNTYRSVVYQMNSDGSAIVNSSWMGEPTPGREGQGIGDIIGDWYAAGDMWRYMRQRENWAFSLMNPYTINRIEIFTNGDLLFLMDGGLRWAGGQDVIYRFAAGDISPEGLIWKKVFDAAGNNSTVASPEHSSVMSADIAITPDQNHVYVTGGSNGWTGAEPYWNPFVFKFDANTGDQLWERSGVAKGGPHGILNIIQTSVPPLISDSYGQAMYINSSGESMVSMWADGGATFLLNHPWTLTGDANNQDGDGFWGFKGRSFATVMGRLSPDGVSGWKRSHRIKPNPNSNPDQNATLLYGIAPVHGAANQTYAVGFSRGMSQVNPLFAGTGAGVIVKLELADSGTTRQYVERLPGITEMLSIANKPNSKQYIAAGYGAAGAPVINALQANHAGSRDGYLIQFTDSPVVAVTGDGTQNLSYSIESSTGLISFEFTNTRVATYRLEVSDDLGQTSQWTLVPTATASPAAIGESITFEATLQGTRQFFRIVSE